MTTSSKHTIGLLVVLWSCFAIMGALAGAKGSMLGWFTFVVSLVAVFMTCQVPAESPAFISKVLMTIFGLGVLSAVLLILYKGGALD